VSQVTPREGILETAQICVFLTTEEVFEKNNITQLRGDIVAY
jgi:hypothetical protein